MDFSGYAEYLHGLGMSEELSAKICQKFQKGGDLKGLVDYILVYEVMVESCVD